MNGQLPDSALSKIPGGRLARGGPARSWLAMRTFIGRKHGVWIEPTGPYASYRTLATQKRFYANYLSGTGPLAAVPGSSNHGIGLAVDIPTPEMQRRVRDVGHLFGFGIMGGQIASDAKNEAWHVVYRGPYTRLARLWYARHLLSAKANR